MAAAARRSRPAPNMAAPSARPSIFCPAVISRAISASRIPTSAVNAIHDYTNQGKFFGYASTLLEDNGRLTFLTGSAVSRFQIPNIPGQPTVFPLVGVPNGANGLPIFDSAGLNERQWERSYYGVLAWQKSVENVDVQVSYFSRYNSVHFVPDATGDLIFNGVASDITRNALVNGVQADAAYHLNDTHTIRTGMVTSGERTNVTNSSLVFPGSNDPAVGPIPSSDVPIGVFDANSKTGWLFGLYVQDEWKLTDKLTLNTGLRFDQMWQFVDANQFSPRVNLVYKPFETTNVHVGYARYFTPPVQAIATPAEFRDLQRHRERSRPERPRQQPDAARALACLRRRRDAEVRALPGRRRRLLQAGARPDRRRPVRRRARVDRLQLRQGLQLGARAAATSIRTAGSRPISTSPGRRSAPRTSCRTSSCSRPTTSPSSPATTSTPTTPRRSRVRPARPICGTRRCFSAKMIFGSGLRSGDDNIGPSAVLHPGRCRRLARVRGAGRKALHAALRHRQRLRHQSTRSATARASACSRRNSARAAATMSGFSQKFGPG